MQLQNYEETLQKRAPFSPGGKTMINLFNQLLNELRQRVDPMMTHLMSDYNQNPSMDLFAQKLVLIQHFLNEQLTVLNEANDYIVLVRFYVDNTGQTDIHPGINSWEYCDWKKKQEKNQTEQMLLPNNKQKEIAQQHMYYGHDTESEERVIMKSPFISTTYNVDALLAADSPFNTNRTFSMMGKRDAEVRKGSGQRQPAMHVSDKIITLIYGHSNATIARTAKTQRETGNTRLGCVANRIAFLLVPKSVVVLPPKGTNSKACCMLEAEAVIYAPQIDVSAWVIVQINNNLPQLAGRFQDL